MSAIFIVQTVFKYFQLEYAYYANNVTFQTNTFLLEYLDSTFLRQLKNAFFKLLTFHGVFRLYASKNFRREYREIFKLKFQFAIAQGVANTKDTGVKYTDDIARISFFNNGSFLRKELLRLSKFNNLVGLFVINAHALIKYTGADTHKGNSVAVSRVHVSLDFKNKSRECFILR